MREAFRKHRFKIILTLLCTLFIILLGLLAYRVYSQYDGVYVCEDYKDISIEFNIKLKGTKFEMSVLGADVDKKITGNFNITNNTIKLCVEENIVEGIYDKDQNCLIIDGFVFYKE